MPTKIDHDESELLEAFEQARIEIREDGMVLEFSGSGGMEAVV